MLSKEKLIIRTHKLTSNLTFQFIFWELAFLFFVFITGKEYLYELFPHISNTESIYITLTFLSILASLLFTTIDLIFTDRLVRFFPVQFITFVKSIFYFLTAFVILIAATLPSANFIQSASYSDIIMQLPDTNIYLFRFLVYFYVSCFINSFFMGYIKKVGSSNFRRIAYGVLNKPHEQERIFMFLDLKDSTSLAEKLGHKKFSHLVQDLFNDMSVVDNYGGEIYQYLGDGAIVSWSLKKGLKNDNYLKAFYAFSGVIQKRKRYYNRKYKIEPKFKAGAHVGKVMVLLVGQIKRDISYNGDTMNTAARIESKCNELKQQMLISTDLYNLMPQEKNFRFKNVGEIALRGKRKSVEIYAVKPKIASKKK